jgi:hypothetical protein
VGLIAAAIVAFIAMLFEESSNRRFHGICAACASDAEEPFTPSIVPRDDAQDINLVEDDRGASGSVWCEAPVTGNDFEAGVFFRRYLARRGPVPFC